MRRAVQPRVLPGPVALVDLSANENPLGPSPAALGGVQAALAGLHRYPDRTCARLKSALAARLGVGPQQIAIGNGSCEVLDLAVRSLIAPGERVVLGNPGFPAYRGAVRRAGAQAVLVPARDYRDDLDAMLAQVDAATRLVVLGNPGNPTGTVIDGARLIGFLRRLPPGVTLLLDEAYRDFVEALDYPDAVELQRDGWPVVALRSFSKVEGLAGLRVGYAVAAPSFIARLDAEHQQFNTNSLAQAAARAALGDRAHVRATVELNRRGRLELVAGLRARGLDPVPSQANFVLVPVGEGAARLVRRLAEQGVLVKDLERYGLNDHIRVSTGRPEDHARFFAALDTVIAEKCTSFSSDLASDLSNGRVSRWC
jgi:histidinol-phosphate aminotransferase